MADAHLVHGCGGISFPHFERFGGSQSRKPNSTDLVAPKTVVEEHDGVFIHNLRLGRSTTSLGEHHEHDLLTLKSSRKSRAGSNPGLLSTLENIICCPVSTPWICADAFSYERGSVDASRWIIKSYSAVGCVFRTYRHGQLVPCCHPRGETYRDILETVGISL